MKRRAHIKFYIQSAFDGGVTVIVSLVDDNGKLFPLPDGRVIDRVARMMEHDTFLVKDFLIPSPSIWQRLIRKVAVLKLWNRS